MGSRKEPSGFDRLSGHGVVKRHGSRSAEILEEALALPTHRRTGYRRRFPRRLLRVAFEPWRSGLPLRQRRVFIADWHLHLRQALSVEYLLLRDDAVYVEQKCRQRIHLIGRQRPLTIERHRAI